MTETVPRIKRYSTKCILTLNKVIAEPRFWAKEDDPGDVRKRNLSECPNRDVKINTMTYDLSYLRRWDQNTEMASQNSVQ